MHRADAENARRGASDGDGRQRPPAAVARLRRPHVAV